MLTLAMALGQSRIILKETFSDGKMLNPNGQIIAGKTHNNPVDSGRRYGDEKMPVKMSQSEQGYKI
ncbi:MAG: hypothetical protein ACI8WB_002247 [Phenylobacterium sp.]|jgi:hypothetical protein